MHCNMFMLRLKKQQKKNALFLTYVTFIIYDD